MHRISRLNKFSAPLRIVQNLVQPSLRQFNTHKKFRPLSLNLIIPPFKQPEVVRFDNLKDLSDMIEGTFKGYLRGRGPNGTSEIILRGKYQNLSQSGVYEVVSPFYSVMIEKRNRRQIEYKAFEDKCHNAMIKFLGDKGSVFRELDRTVRKEGRSVAEWGGIFEMGSGHVLLLECKHCVTSKIVFEQRMKMRKTMAALGKDKDLARIFIAGKYWKTIDDEDPKKYAQDLGFGIVFENGNDLTAIPSQDV